jgi:hypothetical protein
MINAKDWMMHKQLIITRQDKKARQQINVAKVTFFYCLLTFSSKCRGNLRLQLREASTANYIISGVVANQKTLIYNLYYKKNVVTINNIYYQLTVFNFILKIF